MQTTASTKSVAAEATATPRLGMLPEWERSVAPSNRHRRKRAPGRTWQKELVAHLDKHKRYPPERLQKNVEILVHFMLDRLGHVVSTTIVKGSGDPVFDKAALAMVQPLRSGATAAAVDRGRRTDASRCR